MATAHLFIYLIQPCLAGLGGPMALAHLFIFPIQPTKDQIMQPAWTCHLFIYLSIASLPGTARCMPACRLFIYFLVPCRPCPGGESDNPVYLFIYPSRSRLGPTVHAAHHLFIYLLARAAPLHAAVREAPFIYLFYHRGSRQAAPQGPAVHLFIYLSSQQRLESSSISVTAVYLFILRLQQRVDTAASRHVRLFNLFPPSDPELNLPDPTWRRGLAFLFS